MSASVCSACGAAVTWVRFPDGTTRPLERCPEGTGDVAIQPALPGLGARALEARIVGTVRTSFRLHVPHCARRGSVFTRGGERRCTGCLAPLPAGTRVASCSRCQTRERDHMAEVVGNLVEKFGESGVREHVTRALASRRARRS